MFDHCSLSKLVKPCRIASVSIYRIASLYIYRIASVSIYRIARLYIYRIASVSIYSWQCSVLQCRDNKQSIKISKRLTVHLTHLNIVNIWYNHTPTCFPLPSIDALLNFYISMFCIFSIYLQFLSKFGIGTA